MGLTLKLVVMYWFKTHSVFLWLLSYQFKRLAEHLGVVGRWMVARRRHLVEITAHWNT